MFTAVVLAVLGGASPGAADPSLPTGPWKGATQLSNPLPTWDGAAVEQSGSVASAVLPDGTALVAWVGRANRMWVASRPPGRSWSTRVIRRVPGTSAFGPQLAVGPGRRVTLVWEQASAVRAMSRRPGRQWSRPVTIDSWDAAQQPLSSLDLAVGGDGRIAIAWWRGTVGTCGTTGEWCRLRHVIATTVIRPAGEGWLPPQRIAGPVRHAVSSLPAGQRLQVLPAPQVAAYGSTKVTVAWAQPRSELGVVNTSVVVRTRGADGEWFPRRVMSSRGTDPLLSGNRRGRLVLVYRTHHGRRDVDAVFSMIWGADTPGRQHVWTGRSVQLDDLAVDQLGSSTLALESWVAGQGTPRVISVTRHYRGKWSTSSVVAVGGWNAQLLTSPSGARVLAAWQTPRSLRVRWGAPAGRWGPVAVLAHGPSLSYATSLNAKGAAAVAWYQRVSAHRAVVTASLHR